MKVQRFSTRPYDRAGLRGTAGLVLVSLLVSFGYVQERSAHSTQDRRPRSRTLLTYAGTLVEITLARLLRLLILARWTTRSQAQTELIERRRRRAGLQPRLERC